MNTKNPEKRILCFGDSNTWGYIPGTNHGRYPNDIRWTGALQKILGDKYEVIEEGLNGRTLGNEDNRPGKEGRDGREYFLPCIDSHDPVDFVVLFLGTNDLKAQFNSTSKSIGDVFEKNYIEIVHSHESNQHKRDRKLILVIPPNPDTTKDFAKERYSDEITNKIDLPSVIKKLAEKHSLQIVDMNESKLVGNDGVHLTSEAHSFLANQIAAIIRIQ